MFADPPLGMLWETVDPADALATRFGFPDTAHALEWLADVLDSSWAIPLDGCDRLVLSSGNLLAWITAAGRRLIVKCSVVPERFARLAEVAELTAWLQARGIPVAAPVPTVDGRLRVERDGRSLGVIPVIDGHLLDVEVPAQVDRAGRMLAAVHEALAAYPRAIDGGRPEPPEQLVHNDFRSANILHDATGIVAVLDLEEVRYRSRVADLAQAAVLLGTRYHDWGPTTPEVRCAFVAAYHDRAPLTAAEQVRLPREIADVLDRFGWSEQPGRPHARTTERFP